jgi:hypothetical protein
LHHPISGNPTGHHDGVLAMDDLERWLRTAMQAAQQRPSPDLLDGIWRRRRAHLRRARAWSAAAVVAVAIAVPSVLRATAGGLARPTRPAATATHHAAPGSELLKCGAYSDRGISGGQLDAHWQSASVNAGPVWFVFARSGVWRSSQQLPNGRFGNVAGPIVAVKNGVTVEITTPAADWSHFRFLTRATRSGSYTLNDGVRGLTLVGCPSYRVLPGIPPGDAPGMTLFYLPLGYVTDLSGCLPLRIAEPPSWHVRWTADLCPRPV